MPDSAIKPLDLIIGRSLLTAETIMQELRERLLNLPYAGFLSHEQLLEAARNILDEYEDLQVEALANTDLASWILGFDRVAAKLPEQAKQQFAPFWRRPPSDPPRFPPIIGGAAGGDEPPEHLRFPIIERAAQNLFDRQILTPNEYYAAESRERDKAFTVARESREDVLERIRDRLAETVEEGASLKVFREKLSDDLSSSFIGEHHIENVYRTNVQAAFTEGHDTLAENPIVAEIFPFRAYLPITDARTRPEHLALGAYSPKLGIGPLGLEKTNIYWARDPFWRTFSIPWDYQCRCGSNLMTIEAAARAGLQLAQDWLRTGRKPLVESRLPYIPFRPKGGFAKVAA